MKKILSALIFCLLAATVVAQQGSEVRIPLIGETAPKFTAESTLGTITFPDNNNSKWTILLSHPADFTPVCSTEILELAYMQQDFEKLNTRLMVISTDAVSSHIEWVRSLQTVKYKNRQPVTIKFPLISDKGLEISKSYGMLHSYSSTTKDVRGVFIISPDNKIRAIFFYSMETGRNLDEIKRTLQALQTAEKENVLIPANWLPGDDVMLPAPKTANDAEKVSGKENDDRYFVTWYMLFKKMR